MPSTEIQGADSSPQSIPTLPVSSSRDLFAAGVIDQLAGLLPQYLASRRWFRAKARSIEKVSVHDVVPFTQVNSLLILNVHFEDGGCDIYLLPLSLTAAADDSVRNSPASEPLAILRSEDGDERVLYSAFSNPSFRGAILSAIAEEKNFPGREGVFLARRIVGSGTVPEELDPAMDSAVSRAEQSNTSVIYGDKFILKLFRKVEEGINPDIEVGTFLTEHGFANTPPVIGTLEYRRNQGGQPLSAGLLGRFVQNRGDAWKYTLDSLSGFFGRALDKSGGPTGATGQHPFLLADQSVPPHVQELIGPYLASARLLGQRTAEMHAVLAKGNASDFVPEALAADDSARLYGEMQRQADIAFDLLRAKQGSLVSGSAPDARQVLAGEKKVRDRFSGLRDRGIEALRIRFHGDYHLGQVLYTGSEFMIIDFEGEPARPLSERREKGLALRDVAGMVRSFQYAAYAALYGQVAGVDLSRADADLVAKWSAFWYAWVSAAFLRGYFDTAADAAFVGKNREEQHLLLDSFMLHKALYEVAYELNNRPAWVCIPLRGILNLVA